MNVGCVQMSISYSSYKSYFRIIKTNPYEGFIILQLGDILENPIISIE
jgi:hypothetical protein